MRSCASWYERSSSSTSSATLPAMAGLRLALETGVQADFRDARERLRDRAVLLCLLGCLLEGLVVDSRHATGDLQGDLRDALARLKRHGGRRLELLRRMPVLREPVRERHRETGGVGRSDELLWARHATRLLRARGPAHVEPADRAARDRVDPALAAHQVPPPRHFRLAVSRHPFLLR